MRPLSRREGVWIEISERDLPVDFVYAVDVLGSVTVQAPVQITDVIIASEVLATGVVAPPLTDTATVTDALRVPVVTTRAVDQAYVHDVLEFAETTGSRDTGVAIDSLSGLLRISGTRADLVVAYDALGATTGVFSADGLVAGDTLSASLTAETLRDTVFAPDDLGSRLTLSVLTSEVRVATDVLGFGLMQSTADVVVASDALSGSVAVFAPVLTDTVVASEGILGATAVYAEGVSDGIVASDTLSGVLALVGVLSDTGVAGDTLYERAYPVLVVTNAETGAVSTYTMTPTVAGVADYRGTLYLACADGLYAMDATEDEDGAVAWTLRAGFSPLGTDRIKRIQDVNVLARTEGETTLQVVSDRFGVKQTWDYTLPPLTRHAYRDGVIKVGKGVQSVYYQLALAGTGPAEIDQLRLTVEPLSRRR